MGDIKSLGYIKIQTSDIDRWRSFAFDVLGFAQGSGPDRDALYLRMDERFARIIVVPGEADQVVHLGWEVRDGVALQRVRDTLERAGVTVTTLSVEEADERRVEDAIAFTDPTGTPTEVFFGPALDHSPVVTPFGATFVTGTQGLGHVVLPTMDPGGASAFYSQTWAFWLAAPCGYPHRRSSARCGSASSASTIATTAWRCAPRRTVGRRGWCTSWSRSTRWTPSGRALDRVVKQGHSLSSTLGRHTNDKMVSFYVRAPGGWDIEFGTDGLKVDETYYTAEEITADSYWGHDWSGAEPLAAM